MVSRFATPFGIESQQHPDNILIISGQNKFRK